MHYTILLAALAIEGGTLMVNKGAKMLLPELAKLLDNPEIEDLYKALAEGSFVEKALDAYRKLCLESK